jgi:short-subunit dehydrogenase
MTNRRVVFITGASSGIGAASALAFARRGDHVAGTARRADRLDQLAAQVAALDGDHGDLLPVALDVRDAEAVHAAVQQTIERFGRLDVLVANAGVGHRGSVTDSDWDDIDALLRTNIDGVLHSMRAAVPHMRQRGGHIVLLSSIVHNMTSPYAAVYAASKAFVTSLGRSLRLELESDNIRVSVMLIGRTESEFSEKRLGQSGYSEKASRLPRMTSEQVAEAIVHATEGKRHMIAIRWFDRIVMLANLLVPNFIGRRALRQYR